MPPPLPNSQQQQRLVWWVLWAAFQTGIVIIYIFMGQPSPSHFQFDNEPPHWQLGLLPVLISAAIRWTLLPLIKTAVKALPCFIFGVAMAEFTCFLGIFIFPSHQTLFFIASVIGIFQFIPIYYGQFLADPDK